MDGHWVEPLIKEDDDDGAGLLCLARPRTRTVRETCVIDRLSLAVCGDQSQSRIASTQRSRVNRNLPPMDGTFLEGRTSSHAATTILGASEISRASGGGGARARIVPRR